MSRDLARILTEPKPFDHKGFEVGDLIFNVNYDEYHIIMEFTFDIIGATITRTVSMSENGHRKLGEVCRWAGWPNEYGGENWKKVA